jgi:hypothetical protein
VAVCRGREYGAAAEATRAASGSVTPGMSRNEEAGARRATKTLTLLLPFLASLFLALPSMRSPFFEDDLFHRAMLSDSVPGLHWGPLELYDFIGGPSRPARELRERGFAPWFTADDLKVRFLRPLSSATLAADARLFGPRAWMARLHSLGWFLAILAVVTAINRRFLTPGVAALATLIYALAAAHALSISWIAARHTLVSSAFALLAFWLHVRHREDLSRSGAWLGPLVLMAGLCAGEMALGGIALIAAFELLGHRDGLLRRLVALAPAASIALIYLGLYLSLDYGAQSSGGYVGLDGRVSSLLTIARHFWILLGEMVSGIPSDAVIVATPNQQAVAAWCGVGAALVAWAVASASWGHWEARHRNAIGWMAAASLGAALPGTFSILGGRVLTMALVPASGVMAVLLSAGASAIRDRTKGLSVRILLSIALGIFALLHLVFAPFVRVAMGLNVTNIAYALQDQMRRVPSCPGVMVMVAAADPTISMYVPAALVLEGRAPERVRLLSMAAVDHRIERVTRTGFDLVSNRSGEGRTIWERLYRGAPVPAGTRVTMGSFDVQVVEDREGAPVRTRFDFGEPLDSPHLCFVQWRDGNLARLTPPGPGETVDLPYTPGPMGF